MRSAVVPLVLAVCVGCKAELGVGAQDSGADTSIPPDGAVDAPPDTVQVAPDAGPPPCTEGDARLLGGPEGSCYMRFSTPATWPAARDACAALSPPAHLIIVSSAAENAFFAPLVDDMTPPDFFMGATDSAVEGTFVWVDGSAMTYDNWRDGEPNDGGDGPGGEDEEDCTIIEGDTALFTWDDRPCMEPYPYVCERDAQ